MKSLVLMLVGLWLYSYWIVAMEVLSEPWSPIVEPGADQSLLVDHWRLPLVSFPGPSAQYIESSSKIYQLPRLGKLRSGFKRLLSCLDSTAEEATPFLAGSPRESQFHGVNLGADQRLRIILYQIESILKTKQLKLILSLDIDKTITYGSRSNILHQSYFELLRAYMGAHPGSWLWIYNTSRYPGSLSLNIWTQPFPAPNILIMGGGAISYDWALKGNYPGLVDIEMDERWMNIWPVINFPALVSAHSADHASLCYYDRNQNFLTTATVILEQKQGNRPDRLGIWNHPPSEQYYGLLFCYDRQYNKGAALRRVIEELSSRGALNGRYRLITSGDEIADSAMMNSQLRFPFDHPNRLRQLFAAPLGSTLPWNVSYLGSVIPHGAAIGTEEFREELLSGVNTVDAKEPNVLGIMEGVLRLLQADQGL